MARRPDGRGRGEGPHPIRVRSLAAFPAVRLPCHGGGMRITPEALEGEFSLTTAATRLDFLSRRDDGSTTLDTEVARRTRELAGTRPRR